MTKEQKLDWLKNADAKELLNQFRSFAIRLNKAETFSKEWQELIEDFALTEQELLRRLEK